MPAIWALSWAIWSSSLAESSASAGEGLETRDEIGEDIVVVMYVDIAASVRVRSDCEFVSGRGARRQSVSVSEQRECVGAERPISSLFSRLPLSNFFFSFFISFVVYFSRVSV